MVTELMSSLIVGVDNDFGTRLLRLYEYVYRRLVEGNILKDLDAVKEVGIHGFGMLGPRLFPGSLAQPP